MSRKSCGAVLVEHSECDIWRLEKTIFRVSESFRTLHDFSTKRQKSTVMVSSRFVLVFFDEENSQATRRSDCLELSLQGCQGGQLCALYSHII